MSDDGPSEEEQVRLWQLMDELHPENWQWRHFGGDPENTCRIVDYSHFDQDSRWDIHVDDIEDPRVAEFIALAGRVLNLLRPKETT